MGGSPPGGPGFVPAAAPDILGRDEARPSRGFVQRKYLNLRFRQWCSLGVFVNDINSNWSPLTQIKMAQISAQGGPGFVRAAAPDILGRAGPLPRPR